jgi:hypothetical protein
MGAEAKERQEDARRLRKFTACDSFSDDELLRIARAATCAATSGPWPLIHEQTPSDACCILLSGEAGVYVGRDRIAVVGPGEVIGESVLRRRKLRNRSGASLRLLPRERASFEPKQAFDG